MQRSTDTRARLTTTKLYHYPAHAVRIFDSVVKERAARGQSLRSLTKGFLLGTGVTLRFEFEDTPTSTAVEQRLTYAYGRRREESVPGFDGWRVASVLPMRTCWVTIGHYYWLTSAPERASSVVS